jgi:DNA-binding NtrC family response regulator/tetratricopeptide (TPR) repeat protein
MDRLLVFDDAHRASPDLAAMLRRLAMLPPPGLRLVVSAPEVPEFVPPARRKVRLEGEAGEADDLPLQRWSGELEGCGQPEPSWYGPRIRCPGGAAGDSALPEAARLHAMGADRVAASLADDLSPEDEGALPVAASLIRLGRWREALRLLPEHAALLRGQALLGLGNASDAVPLLRAAFEEEARDTTRCLLARALVAAGSPAQAEELLRHGRSAGSAVALADLLDSLGRPAEAIGPLRRVVEEAPEAPPEVLCAQARIYMRLGRYAEALERTDRAVAIAGSLGRGETLVEGLLTRGRTREVLGDWKQALGDYRMAVALFDAASSSAERPPHVDLYVLLLRTGRLEEADGIWDRLLASMRTSGGAVSRMEQMLLAYRAVLLGRGEEGLPFARRAAEMAAAERNPLHQALSTMYAGVLTVQAGRRKEGLDTIRRARARAGMLGDRHLQLMCDLELLAAGDRGPGEDLRLAAGEMGLVPEELRAAVIQHRETEALETLLELPAPLEALAAARCITSLPPALAARLRKAQAALSEGLPEGEAESLAELCRDIPGGPTGPGADGSALLREVSRWARRRLAEGAPLQELADSLGIGCLDTSPSEACSVKLCGDPPLYASSGVPGLEDAAALVAALASATVEEAGAAPRSADYPELVGSSQAMRELRAALDRAIGCSAPVLLLGETGTGKELAARAIHRGRETGGPFVPVDCGAIPHDLLESELFGAAKGAYTGLREDRQGLVEEARGGTLFLDEIGNMPEQLQVKLLRALDTGRFRRLGENRERESSFRLVAATNRDLRREVSRGEFRDDLYYRIAVMVIEMPPLRERRGDIPLLARHFLRRMEGSGDAEITAGALRKLEGHTWPGNVRELRNVIQRAVALAGSGDVRGRHIRLSELPPRAGAGRLETIRLATARHVREVVEKMEGNRTRAADVLDCDPKTVRKYLRIASEEMGQP